MPFFRNLKLLTKIILIVLIIHLGFFALSTVVSYRQNREFILNEAVEKARTIAYEAIRAREYLSIQLQIGDIELSNQRYGLIPVVASTRIGELVAEDLGFTIRQVSNRYRNPKNAPDSYEAGVLQKFFEEPGTPEHFDVTELEGEPVFRYLMAFRAESSCLLCHGDAETAPAFIKELFPQDRDRAYGYTIGEVIGAASVTIPMDRLKEQIITNVRHELAVTAIIFALLVLSLGLLTRMAVTAPLGRLGAALRRIVRDDRFEEEIPRRGQDEIGVLIEAFNEMTGHLREKTRRLEESEGRLNVLTETASDAIVSFLSNGQVILFNRQAERIFGYGKREILGVSVERLVHEDCLSLRQTAIEDYLKHSAGALVRKPHVIVGRRRDGSPLRFDLALSVAESDGHLFYTAILREHKDA